MMHSDLFTPALSRALDHATAYLDSLPDGPVGATASPEDLLARLSRPLADDGVDPLQVIDELARDAAPGLHRTAGGRFFGWVIGGSIPVALATDLLTSAWDQNGGALQVAPASAVTEAVAAGWLKELLGIPPTAGVAFATGSQTAHVIALAAARHAQLARFGINVEREGMSGAPKFRILANALRHISVDRAVRYLGFGADAIEPLPVDAQMQVTPETLESALGNDSDRPTIIVLQAGDLNTGQFDRFAELIPIAHRHNAWVHVDGAFGLWAAASPAYRHLMAGAELADSWVTDGHKWLNVPYDRGFAFVADTDAHRAAMGYSTSYLPGTEETIRDPRNWDIEMSRRARGFTVYAAIRALGRNGIAEIVDSCCSCAADLVRKLGELDGCEVLWSPIINQGVVRFLSPVAGATDADHDARTTAVVAEIVRSGEAFFGLVDWNGAKAMRISVSSWQTTAEDVDRTVAAFRMVLAET
jgi:glutamate/tyrosine decarboxylase-like PLP-dependent enzyme